MNEVSHKPFVFVLMPFSKDFDDIYEVGIKPACEDAGAYCERVAEQIFLENILQRIYAQIAKADVVVAEMSSRNPNVFYETGYAHALHKRVILLIKDVDDIPFDLKHYPHIIYGGSIAILKRKLEAKVKWCIDKPEESLSSVDSDPPRKEASRFLDRTDAGRIFDLQRVLENAKQIDILGYSCALLLEQYPDNIVDAVVRGSHVRILVVKPHSPAAELMVSHTFTRPLEQDVLLTQKRVDYIKEKIQKASNENKGNFEVRYTTWIPSCGLTIANRDSGNGILRVQIYPICHATWHSSLIPHQIVSEKDDSIWFDYFVQQYNRLWDETTGPSLLLHKN